jgi:hypothetical protein
MAKEIGLEENDKDFDGIPIYLQWYILGALQVLALNNDMIFHQEVRRTFFNKCKGYNDETIKAFLTINKKDIDYMGM